MNQEMENKMDCLFQNAADSLMISDPEWSKVVTDFAMNEVLKENKLTKRERMLCILSVLLGCQGLGEFCNMLHTALNDGLDPTAIKEIIYQGTAYLGIGRIYDFLTAANRIIEQHGFRFPLAQENSPEENTRFERGLEKQVSLFGEEMAKRQTEAPAARRNINRWLTYNCFGDYYTRTGLNDQEREMITFCFLLAQGGCEKQLRGHTAGNLGVGNGKEKLYSIVEQCMPYIGYPRSLNAMDIIDEMTQKIEKQ